MDFKALVQQLMQMREGGQQEQSQYPWQRPQGQHMSPMQAMQQPGYNPLMRMGPAVNNASMPRDQWTPGARWQGALPRGAKFI
jgi:hypothetical protein